METVKKLGIRFGIDGYAPGAPGYRWRMKASMHFPIRVEWHREDGTAATPELVTADHGACESTGDVGLKLAEAKRIY